jgi:hypothetical protein
MVLWRPGKEDCEFEASLGYIADPASKQKTKLTFCNGSQSIPELLQYSSYLSYCYQWLQENQ